MSKFKVGNQEAQVHIEMSSKLLPSAPSSTRAKNTSKKNHIKRQESRALSLHSELGASVELAASWGGVPVMENVMKHRSVLEKQLAGVEKALAKLDRQVEVINTLPEGNIHKQVCYLLLSLTVYMFISSSYPSSSIIIITIRDSSSSSSSSLRSSSL